MSKFPTENVFLEMLCEGEGKCKAKHDMTQLLSSLDLDKWQSVSVDLACFSDKGLDMAKLITPFKLSTQGELSLSFADISLSSQSSDQASVTCSNN